MPFTSIDKATIQPGKAGVGIGGFGEDVIDNLNFLNGQIGSLEAQSILNGSFEIEDDASAGVPANWERTLFAGGAGAFETADPMHGAQGYKFTHPGGGGNGGGSLESDYFTISEFRNLLLEWMHYVSAAGMHETVEVEYFTDAQVGISTQTIYDSLSNPVAATLYQLPLIIPATARFLKVKVIGGKDDVDVAGDSFWDGVRIVFEPLQDADANVDEVHAVVFAHSVLTNIRTANVGVYDRPLKEIRLARGGDINITFLLATSGAEANVQARLYKGTVSGTLGVTIGVNRTTTSPTFVTFSETISGLKAGDIVQLTAAPGTGSPALVRDLKLASRTLFGEEVILEQTV